MNKILLSGYLRNICYSHTINNVEYDKADLIVKRDDSRDDVISLRFKKYSNPYVEGQYINIVGNLRSYSYQQEGKNKVNLYVFTYFDIPIEEDEIVNNEFEVDGRICKIDELRITNSGKHNLHFVLANNIISANNKQKLNNYLPSTIWGKNAIEFSKLKVSDKVKLKGQLHSHTYKKELPDGEIEFRTAHELLITDYEVVE